MITSVGPILLLSAVQAAAGVVVVSVLTKGKPGMFVLGLLIPGVTIFGAVRLAKPGSVWARASYDDETLALSVSRFGGAVPVVGPVVDMPRQVRIGVAAVAGSAAAMFVAAPFGGFAAGAVGTIGLLVARGWAVGRWWIGLVPLLFSAVVLTVLLGPGIEPVELRVPALISLAAPVFAAGAVWQLAGPDATAYFRWRAV